MSTPIEISLNNRFNEPLVYLPDGPQDLVLDVRNIWPGVISLDPAPLGQTTLNPSFNVLFRPRVARVVANTPPLKLRSAILSDDTGDHDVLAAWSTNATDEDNTGLLAVSLTTSAKVAIPSDGHLRIAFTIDPDANSGARLARVEVNYRIALTGTATPIKNVFQNIGVFEGTELLQLNLVDISRKGFEVAMEGRAITSVKAGPFEASFLGSNVIVNDGKTSNTLHIRVRPNPEILGSATGVELTAASRLHLALTQADQSRPWGLIVKTDLGPNLASQSIGITSQPDTVWHFHPAGRLWVGSLAEWKSETETDPGGFLDIALQVKSLAPSGFAPISIEYSNIPGHADGALLLIAQLGPVFVEEDVTSLLNGKEPFSHAASIAFAKPLAFVGPNARADNGTLSAAGPHIGLGADNSSLRISAGSLDLDGPVNSLTVGRFGPGAAPGRASVSGKNAELSFIRRDLQSWNASSIQAGDRFAWYNENGKAAKLWTEKNGDLFFVSPSGDVGIGAQPDSARLDVRLPNGVVQVRDTMPVMVSGLNRGGALYFGVPNANNPGLPTAGIETSWGGTDPGGAPNNPQIAIGVTREFASKNVAANLLLDFQGNAQLRQGRNARLTIQSPAAGGKLLIEGSTAIGLDTAGDATALTLTNRRGGLGTGCALDFNTFQPGANPSARIEAIDVGSFTNDIRFMVNRSGAAGDGLVERLRIASDGSLFVSGNLFVNGKKPIVFQTFSVLADNPKIATGFSSLEFTAVAAGFNGRNPDNIHGVMVLPIVRNHEWFIDCDLAGPVDKGWDVFVMFVRNELVEVKQVFVG